MSFYKRMGFRSTTTWRVTIKHPDGTTKTVTVTADGQSEAKSEAEYECKTYHPPGSKVTGLVNLGD